MAGNDRKVSMIAADDVVGPAAEEAGGKSDRQADQDGDADREQAGIDGGRRAVDQPAENVAAEVVGAEQMAGSGGGQHVVGVLRGRRIRRDPGCADRHDHQHQQDQNRQRRAQIAGQPAEQAAQPARLGW